MGIKDGVQWPLVVSRREGHWTPGDTSLLSCSGSGSSPAGADGNSPFPWALLLSPSGLPLRCEAAGSRVTHLEESSLPQVFDHSRSIS